ncbi:MAG: hypothetical protein P8Y58_13820 [Novosphingobium sp.]
MSIIRKAALGTALAATALVSASPAMARDHHRSHDNTAAVAIGAGVIGLALGAIIASSGHDRDRDRDRYYRSSYSYGPAYTSGWYYRDGYYWDRDGRRYNRAEYRRHYRDHDRRDSDGWRDRNNRRDHDNRYGEYRRGY